MMDAIEIRCLGKVQGVFYRVSTKETADQLGLKGWVRNEPDGSVLVYAEGDSESLKKLVAWCEIGPQFARVTEVRLSQTEVIGFESFEIRHF
jgi:acylphosphatase